MYGHIDLSSFIATTISVENLFHKVFPVHFCPIAGDFGCNANCNIDYPFARSHRHVVTICLKSVVIISHFPAPAMLILNEHHLSASYAHYD